MLTLMVGVGYHHPSVQWPNTPMDERQRGNPVAVACKVGLGLFGCSWWLVTALFPVISDHSDLWVSRHPCCLAAGHCLAPCDLGSLGHGSLPASSLLFLLFDCPFSGLAALRVQVALLLQSRMHESSLGLIFCR